ncbi:MAG: L-rhamnose mutarotase [Bacteroidales bacterium]|jgi:L-rhamnose mutarotase|nr:L-rhamnose mutarotase [Bacteroidales bacterium]
MAQGYEQRQSAVPTKRYVQYLEISDNPALLAEYRKWHSEAYHWKEIRDGIRAVGILEMEIYLTGNHLTMIVDVPADFDWQKAMNQLADQPRQAEWEAFVAKFQNCVADARSDEKWTPMERIFRLYE